MGKQADGPNPRMTHAHSTPPCLLKVPYLMQNQKQTTSKLPPCLYTHVELETPLEHVAQDEFSGAVLPSLSSVLGGCGGVGWWCGVVVTLCPGPAARSCSQGEGGGPAWSKPGSLHNLAFSLVPVPHGGPCSVPLRTASALLPGL